MSASPSSILARVTDLAAAMRGAGIRRASVVSDGDSIELDLDPSVFRVPEAPTTASTAPDLPAPTPDPDRCACSCSLAEHGDTGECLRGCSPEVCAAKPTEPAPAAEPAR